jgi:hypothetical protein
MIRNLKILGLAVMATLALGAMSASAASAYQATFTPTGGAESANLTGIGFEKPNTHRITFGEYIVSCEMTHFTGKLPGASALVTLSPVYGSCTTAITGFGTQLPVTIEMNECHHTYVLDPGGVEKDEYTGKFEISCPKGKEVEVRIFLNGTKHGENSPFCTFDIAPQTAEEDSTFINDTAAEAKDVTIKTSSVLSAKRTGSPFCSFQENLKVIYHGSTTLYGLDTETGNPVGLHMG